MSSLIQLFQREDAVLGAFLKSLSEDCLGVIENNPVIPLSSGISGF